VFVDRISVIPAISGTQSVDRYEVIMADTIGCCEFAHRAEGPKKRVRRPMLSLGAMLPVHPAQPGMASVIPVGLLLGPMIRHVGGAGNLAAACLTLTQSTSLADLIERGHHSLDKPIILANERPAEAPARRR